MRVRLGLLLSILFATLLYTGMVSAYNSPEGDPFYTDNYALDEEFYKVAILSDVEDVVPIPEPINTAPCTAAMNYNDYVSSGYGMN